MFGRDITIWHLENIYNLVEQSKFDLISKTHEYALFQKNKKRRKWEERNYFKELSQLKKRYDIIEQSFQHAKNYCDTWDIAKEKLIAKYKKVNMNVKEIEDIHILRQGIKEQEKLNREALEVSEKLASER